jgi:hypothetical protein
VIVDAPLLTISGAPSTAFAPRFRSSTRPDLVPGDRAFVLRVTVVDLDQYDRAGRPPMPVRVPFAAAILIGELLSRNPALCDGGRSLASPPATV